MACWRLHLAAFLAAARAMPVVEMPQKAASSVQRQSPTSIDAVNSELSSLKDNLRKIQRGNEEELVHQQAAFRQQLQQQEKISQGVQQSSSLLQQQIQHLESENAVIRERAKQVKGNIDALKHSVQALSANLTDARNFAANQLRDHEADADAPELEILRQLDVEDATRGLEQIRKQRLDAIESAGVSLLQVVQDSAIGGALEERMKALKSQHSRNIDELTAQFKEQYKQGAALQQNMLKEQSEFQEMKASLLQHRSKLSKALESLEATEAFLSQHENSLRGYFATVGNEGAQAEPQLRRQSHDVAAKHDLTLLDPSAPVFLQVSSSALRTHSSRSKRRGSRKHVKLSHRVTEASDDVQRLRHAEQWPQRESQSVQGAPQEALPESKEDTEGGGSGSVFESVSSKVKTLEAQLEEAELENKQTLAKHQVQYEQSLNAKRDRNLRCARTNAKLVSEIEGLRRANQAVRDRAEAVREDTKVLREDLRNLRTNLSAAIEFTAGVLDKTAESNASQLSVLDELKQTDASRGALEEHEQRLREIAETAHNGVPSKLAAAIPAMPSFLQVGMAKEPPKALLQTLNAGFEELKAEHDKAEAELKNKFSAAFKKENDRYQSLLNEQRSLNQTKEGLTSLGDRLHIALAHLESTRKILEERGRSLRVYAQRLGIRPFPHQRSVTMESRRMMDEEKATEDTPKPETVQFDQEQGEPEVPAESELTLESEAEGQEHADLDEDRTHSDAGDELAKVTLAEQAAAPAHQAAKAAHRPSPVADDVPVRRPRQEEAESSPPSLWSALFGR